MLLLALSVLSLLVIIRGQNGSKRQIDIRSTCAFFVICLSPRVFSTVVQLSIDSPIVEEDNASSVVACANLLEGSSGTITVRLRSRDKTAKGTVIYILIFNLFLGSMHTFGIYIVLYIQRAMERSPHVVQFTRSICYILFVTGTHKYTRYTSAAHAC